MGKVKPILLSAMVVLCYYAKAQQAGGQVVMQPDSALLRQMEQNAADIKELKSKVTKMGWGTISFSGYAHFQYVASFAKERVWPEAFITTYGDVFTPEMNNRLQIRRSRLKMTYANGPVILVIQPEFSEKKVDIKDIFVNLGTRNGVLGFRMGLFDRPFGYEIGYSSPNRQAAERSRTINAILPYYRDVGAEVRLAGPGESFLSQFTLHAGVFNGNGISAETDSYKDFIGRLAWLKKFGRTELGAAYSHYYGTIYGGTMRDQTHNRYVYRPDEGFQKREVTETHRRQYSGFSAKLTQDWGIGRTLFMTEWMVGEQPSSGQRFGSSIGRGFNELSNIYLRNFVGGYAYLVQNIANSKHSLLLKFDYLDPNTRVAGNSIGVAAPGYFAATGADIAYTTYSVGYVYDFSHYLRFLVQYDIVRSEESVNLSGYRPGDRFNKDILTFRIQVRYP